MRIEYLYFIFLGLLLLVNVILNRVQHYRIEAYKKILDEKYKQDDTVLIFCLQLILKDYIEKEDYEQAERCRKILVELQDFAKKSPSK